MNSYDLALKEALKVHAQRQKIYGDDWRQQEDWELLALLKMKVKRLEHFVIDRKDEGLYENRKDSLIDIVNYGLFMLANEMEGGSDVEKA